MESQRDRLRGLLVSAIKCMGDYKIVIADWEQEIAKAKSSLADLELMERNILQALKAPMDDELIPMDDKLRDI